MGAYIVQCRLNAVAAETSWPASQQRSSSPLSRKGSLTPAVERTLPAAIRSVIRAHNFAG